MSNAAQSVDVVKDCFGMTEVRKNKSFNVNQMDEKTSDDGSFDEEFHWLVACS